MQPLNPQPTPIADAKNGPPSHDAKGRFVKGNKGGPGNPHFGAIAKIRVTLMEAVTPARFRKACLAVLRKAERGDVYAFRELCNRILGMPHQSVELSGDLSTTSTTETKVTIDWSKASPEELDAIREIRSRLAGQPAKPGPN